MEEYAWYQVVNGTEPLLQGDFFNSCPIVIPPMTIESDTVPADVVVYDIVVMSQSCDLAQDKIDLVLVCPVWPLSEFGNRSSFFRGRDGKEALRKGNVTGYHLLKNSEIEGFETDFQVVDFRNVYGIPLEFLKNRASVTNRRLRLLPPYREHLSQAFARFFMRVGLPVDIPPFR